MKDFRRIRLLQHFCTKLGKIMHFLVRIEVLNNLELKLNISCGDESTRGHCGAEFGSSAPPR